MKKMMKRIGAVLMAVAMMAALGVTGAFASTANTVQYYDTGSITVNGAAKGETYYAIKALDATVSSEGIHYLTPIPDELKAVFEVKELPDGNGNTYEAIDKKDGVTDAQVQDAMRAFATANESNWGTGITCDANSVKFENLAPGYYVIVSTLVKDGQTTLTNKVSAGSTFSGGTKPYTADGVVYEKNEKDQKITKTSGDSYSIGDPVTYTVTFVGLNYDGVQADGTGGKIVVKYEVIDTLPEFLKDAVVDSVKIGTTEYTGTDLNETNFPGITTFGTNKVFYIPWANKKTETTWESKYANGTPIEIKYTATLTKIVKINGDNTNRIKIRPYIDENTPGRRPWEETWKIKTYGAALKKTDGSQSLKGAEFQFKGLKAEVKAGDDAGTYTVIEYDPNGDYTDASTLTVGDDGMLYILGLKDGSVLTGKETKAPKGYNLLKKEFTVSTQIMSEEIWSQSGEKFFDSDGNLVAESTSPLYYEKKDKVKNVSDLDADSVEVINKGGAQLPSTGGIGTYVFTVVGVAIMAVAAGLLIVRHKKKAE